MQCNVGKSDRTLRFVVGVIVVVAGIITKSGWGVFGLFLIASGFTGWCALYKLLGISTGKKQ